MAENGLIKGLYDMAGKTDDNGITQFDEQKLRKELAGNKTLFARNEDLFAEEPKSRTCSMYDPCRICSKCLNKASHLYVRCQTCKIPICVHTYKNRTTLIRRENFSIAVSPEIKQIIRQVSTGVAQC